MKLEDQVCNLDLAKRLKELGVKQKSAFHWKHNTCSENGPIDEWVLVHYSLPYDAMSSSYHLAAFTVAELGEMLPPFIKWEGEDLYLVFERDAIDGLWVAQYLDGDYLVVHQSLSPRAITEADARTKMLIYLLENKLI